MPANQRYNIAHLSQGIGNGSNGGNITNFPEQRYELPPPHATCEVVASILLNARKQQRGMVQCLWFSSDGYQDLPETRIAETQLHSAHLGAMHADSYTIKDSHSRRVADDV